MAILSYLFTPLTANEKLSSVLSVLRKRNILETKRSKEKKIVCEGKKKLSKPAYFYSAFSSNIPATVVAERPPNTEIVAGGHV